MEKRRTGKHYDYGPHETVDPGGGREEKTASFARGTMDGLLVYGAAQFWTRTVLPLNFAS